MTPEGRLTKAITKAVVSYWPDAFTLKLHGSAYQRAGMPDLMIVWRMIPYFLEVKQPGRHATKLQAHTIERLQAAGAVAGVVHSVDEALVLLGLRRQDEPV